MPKNTGKFHFFFHNFFPIFFVVGIFVAKIKMCGILDLQAKNNDVPRAGTPKTMPRKNAAALQCSFMEESTMTNIAKTRRNTMAAIQFEGEHQSNMVRRSARVMAMKTDWSCDEMPPPLLSSPAIKRATWAEKSKANKLVRKTLVCGDDDENDAIENNASPQAAHINFVSRLPHQSSVDYSPSILGPTNKKVVSIDASEDLFAIPFSESDAEPEEHLPSENSKLSAEQEKNILSQITTPTSKQMKSRSTRNNLVSGVDDFVLDVTNATEEIQLSEPQRSNDVSLLPDNRPSESTEERENVPFEISAIMELGESLNESDTNVEKKDGTFDISTEMANATNNLITEDESDAEQQQTKISQMPILQPEEKNLLSVTGAIKKDRKKVTRTSNTIDLTIDSPVINALKKTSDSVATVNTNNVVLSPGHFVKSRQSDTSTASQMTPAEIREKNTKNQKPFTVAFRRNSQRLSNGNKKPPTSAKMKCLVAMATEIAAERSNKHVAFGNLTLNRTPVRTTSMGIKKTPFRLQTEGK